MLEVVIGLILQGYTSNNYGRIGITVPHHGNTITKVYTHSPAYEIGLEKGDKIISADGEPGTKLITGTAGTVVTLKVLHKDREYVYYIPRVIDKEVYDQ